MTIICIDKEKIEGMKVPKNMDGKVKLGHFQALSDILSAGAEVDEEKVKELVRKKYLCWAGQPFPSGTAVCSTLDEEAYIKDMAKALISLMRGEKPA